MMYKLKKQLPNIITLSRIISLVVGFILFMKGNTILSLIFYIYGAISDSIDGYFARKLNAYTKFGQYLDAISDKLYFLSLIIILLVNKKYLIILPMIMELIISIINKKVFTERVGKFKTTLLIITLIVALLSIEIKIFNYLYIIFLVLTTYFHIETICAYINQFHGKSKENIVSFKDKKISERIKLLLDEFMQYIKNPIKIIK